MHPIPGMIAATGIIAAPASATAAIPPLAEGFMLECIYAPLYCWCTPLLAGTSYSGSARCASVQPWGPLVIFTLLSIAGALHFSLARALPCSPGASG